MIVGVQKPPPPLCLLRSSGSGDSSSSSSGDCLSGQYLKDFRICKTCNEWHQAIESIGTLRCRFHPLAFNEDCESEFHRVGVWPCCGVSPNPTDKDFDATFVKGCTMKDHCPDHCLPFPTKVEEADWPSALRESLYDDIETINQCASGLPWDQLVNRLQYKGIRIDPKNSAFYLSRIDDYMVHMRSRHKYFKDERLSVCLRIRLQSAGTDVSYHEIVMETEATVGEVRRRHFPSVVGRMLLKRDSNEFDETTRLFELGGSLEEIEAGDFVCTLPPQTA